MGAAGEPRILLCVWVSRRERGGGVGGKEGGKEKEGERGRRNDRQTLIPLILIMSYCITEVTFLLFSPFMDGLWLTPPWGVIRLAALIRLVVLA